MIAQAEAPIPMEQDFAAIYQEQHGRIFRLCRYLLNSADAAEDAAHEVFLRAQKRESTYDPSLPISSWLSGIATNHCIDLLRRRGTERRVFHLDSAEMAEPPSRGPSPLTEMLVSERGNGVRGALSRLAEKYRVPLVLVYYNEMTYDEIASALGLNRNLVATLIFRAKQQLRLMLQKEKHRGMSH
ncbi:MAG TPA: RNA polymerase sigma factor [Terriglobia bacterium]|nr:RNA polymerase sigma factor [Terriglobia bacterium]